jgi:glutathione peroxidase
MHRILLAALLATLALPATATCPPLLDQRMSTLQGRPADLCQYEGKVLVVVNTASYCGFTNQYKGLEALYQKYRAQGLVVLGVPSNDFGSQEPGSNEQVADFCERTFKVRFPMLEKSVVSGKDAIPLYRALAEKTGQSPRWNFHKYVVGRKGEPLEAFPSAVPPEDPKFLAAVEKALKAR